jgi:hypothetical protein
MEHPVVGALPRTATIVIAPDFRFTGAPFSPLTRSANGVPRRRASAPPPNEELPGRQGLGGRGGLVAVTRWGCKRRRRGRKRRRSRSLSASGESFAPGDARLLSNADASARRAARNPAPRRSRRQTRAGRRDAERTPSADLVQADRVIADPRRTLRERGFGRRPGVHRASRTAEPRPPGRRTQGGPTRPRSTKIPREMCRWSSK